MLKDFCSKRQLWFNYDTPEDFVRSLWQKQPRVSLIWIIYRALLIVYMVSCDILLCASPFKGHVCKKNMIYFTHWAYNTQLLAFAFAFGISVQRYVKEKKDPELPPMEKMPVLYKVTWCIYTIAATTALGVTVMFWVLIFEPDEDDVLIRTVIVHALNSVTIIFDFLMSAIPFRLLHFYWPLLFAIIYMSFSFTYQKAGGTGNHGLIPIYKVLDWREPAKAIAMCAVAMANVLVVHSIMCLFNLLKWYIKRVKDRRMERQNSTATA